MTGAIYKIRCLAVFTLAVSLIIAISCKKKDNANENTKTLYVSENTLDFYFSDTLHTVRITTGDAEQFTYHVTCSNPAFYFIPVDGTCSAANFSSLKVLVDWTHVFGDSAVADVHVTGNNGKSATIHVRAFASASFKSLIVQDSLKFSYTDTALTIPISTLSPSQVSWVATSPDQFVSFSSGTGTCSAGHPSGLTVRINRNMLHKDSVSSRVIISGSHGTTRQVSLFINHFTETKFLLDGNMWDGAYDKVNNRLVLGIGSNTLVIFDIASQAVRKITPMLSLGTPGLALSPDGHYAVITYTPYPGLECIDLNQLTVNELDFGNVRSNAAVGADGNRWFFEQGTPYGSYLGEGNSLAGWYGSVYEGLGAYSSYFQLHPNGNLLYACSYDGYSFCKFNIASIGNPVKVYIRSSGLGSRFWITSDGRGMITNQRTFFRLDPSKDVGDLIYVRDISLSGAFITSFSGNPLHNEFYFISSNNNAGTDSLSTQLVVTDTTFAVKKTITLEPFLTGNSNPPYFQNAEGVLVFTTLNGGQLIVVTRSRDRKKLGIQVINRSWN